VTVEIKVLGPVRATACGMSVMPSAPKQRQILALLALNTGRLVPASTLAEEVWGDDPPRDPQANLQTYVLHLRRKLALALARDGDRSAKNVLTTVPGGYLLDLPVEAVDAGRYEQLVAAGYRALDRQDYDAAAGTLAEALAVWRDRALVDVAVGQVLELERIRLEESRLCTVDRRIEADLRLGRHEVLLDELATLCARHPRFENFHAQYMLALCRSGLRRRALDVYDGLHARVGRQLGVGPSRHLQQLRAAILADDPVVDDPSFVTGDWMARDSV
jgi:SARP family transcriptional regulator, regulator of embCAB operon